MSKIRCIIGCSGESLLRDPPDCKDFASNFYKNDGGDYAALCHKCAVGEAFWIKLGSFVEITREEYIVERIMRS